MKDHLAALITICFVFPLLITSSILFGCSKPPKKESKQLPSHKVQLSAPAQVSTAELSSGLDVIYLDKLYRTIQQMPTVSDAKKQGHPGKPILRFNHQFKKDGLVFESGRKKGVGMVLTGYLHLSKPGEYGFQALANDGIEFYLGKKLIFEDPDVHKDRLSPIGIADTATGGWYPLSIRYFQRKGTATLKLYWQPPGAMEFSIIPEKIYAHKSNKQSK